MEIDNNQEEKNDDLDNLQKVDIFLQQLPYFEDKIKPNGYNQYKDVKQNILKSLAFNEIRPGLIHWSNRLIVFIHEYGLYFDKQEHINLINLYLSVTYTPNLDLPTVEVCLNVLYELLKKTDKLSRKDLVIEWRPIYDLYTRINKLDDYSSELVPENLEQNTLPNFIRVSRVYFDQNATKEMLAEWRLLMCPFDSAMNNAFERLKLFLPCVMYDYESEFGYKLWLDEFLRYWTTFSTRNFWETNLISLLSRVAIENYGQIDWNPYISYIFSNTLRGFGLPFATKDSLTISSSAGSSFSNFTQVFIYSSDDITNLSSLIVSMINSGKTIEQRSICMEHIKMMFKALRSFYYPSNHGSWSSNLFLFLKSLPSMLITRIRKERPEKPKWHHKEIPEMNKIKQEDIDEFVDALKDVVFTAIFSKSNHSDARKAYQHLTFLNGEKMLPPLIMKLYDSLESVTEPMRYTSILSCLTLVAREMVRLEQTKMDVLSLISAILPGLDPNDSNKCILTLQLLSNIFSSIVLMDCSKASTYRNDLSELEVTLCFETSKFEDFLHEFFKRIFYIVDYLANDSSSESSASAAAASNQFAISSRNKSNSQENIYQAHMMQTIKIIIRQSSNDYLKLILNKLKNYLNSNIFNPRSGRILASVCQCLTQSNIAEQSFQIFFTYVYDNLLNIKESKTYEQLAKDERGDIELIWNLQLFSELMKANGPVLIKHADKINLLFSWFRDSINKEVIGFMSSAFRNLIQSLTTIYPLEYCSVNYDISYEDESAFFKQYLPIRNWGQMGNIYKLNIKYHIPSVNELEFAIKFIQSSIQKSCDFLTNNILKPKPTQLSTTLRQESSRELHYFNNIIYGASRLLSRPSSNYVTNHIDSITQIGTDDNIDRGLGFELINVNNESHEYSKLTNESKNMLATFRLYIIDFIIELGEHLIVHNSNETTLLMTIPYILSTASSTYGFFVNDFEKFWKNHHTNKSTMQNKLLGKKSSLREELIQRVMLQYQFRTFYIYTRLNEIDMRIIDLLYKFSTDSMYAVVRKESQTRLFSLISHYPYSSQILVPKLVSMLRRCSSETPDSERLTHEQLKGCLYLLKGNNLQDSLMVKQNWSILSEIWPVLFRCQKFEKPSVQALLDKIYFNANKDHDSFDNRIEFQSQVLNQIYQIEPSLKNITNRLDIFNKKRLIENQLISNLMKELIQIMHESNLLWKNQATSLGSILFLLNSSKLEKKILTYECVKLFVDSLIHENINVRRIAMDGCVVILKMVKYRKEVNIFNINDVIIKSSNDKISINICEPGYRNDNKWHCYDENFLKNCTRTNWDETKFLDKSYWGYYCWPQKITVNSNKRKTFSLSTDEINNGQGQENEYENAMRPFVERFKNDENYFEQFIKLSTIEESKGNEKFDKKKFSFFKTLFRNYGSCDIISFLFDRHLIKLINDKENQTQECSHKLAAEIISGLIRGSKYWPFDQLKQLWSNLELIFDQIIENLTTENLKLYYNCFSTSFEDQDPRRMTFYINYFYNLTKKMFNNTESSKTEKEYTSFQQSSCLHLLAALGQFEWRIQSFWSNLFDLFIKQMDHPYKTIREKIGTCLALCLNNEIDYTISFINQPVKLIGDSKENHKKFIDYLQQRLKQSIEQFDYLNEDNLETIQQQSTDNTHVNFLQTTFSWLGNFFSKSYQPIDQQTIRLIPLLCNIDKIAAQDVLVKTMLPLIRSVFSMWMLDEKHSILFLNELKLTLKFKSWHSRLASVQMVQNYGIFNLFLLTNELKEDIKQLVVEALCEEQLEVRLLAGLALTGFIHSNLIKVDDDLISRLKQLSKIKAKTKDKETGKVNINLTNLVKRHGGILGICSIVNSCPYDVPAYLPDLVTYLCQFTNDPMPIQTSVKKCLSEFRRTHHDNWQEHKLNFNEHQLSTLADILISPNYYA